METVSRFIVAYAINALWQVPLLVIAAELIGKLLGRTAGKVLYRVWLGTLVLALILPTLPLVHIWWRLPNLQSTQIPAAMADRIRGLDLSLAGRQHENFAQKQGVADVPGMVSKGAAGLYLASVLFALGRLAWGLRQTRKLFRSAKPAQLTPEIQRVWSSCRTLFAEARVRLMYSSKLAGPATLNWPDPIVILPEELQFERPNDMNAVFCHELAHVRRKDFLVNILVEVFGVTLFYHPAFHWTRRRIQETRELACDEMAADTILGRHAYARSLLELTKRMLSVAAGPQPSCALGIFEGEILERRIMNLLENRSRHARLRAFTSIAVGFVFLLGTCVLSENFGLGVTHAQHLNQTSSAPKGWFLAGSKPANYATGVDRTMVQNGQPSAYLKSSVPVTEGFGTLMQSISAAEYAGKRVRLRAWVKSQDVADWAGVWMRVDKGTTMVAFDNMQSRPIKGTEPWKRCDVVLDVPEDATGIFFGILLTGTGEVWMSDVSFDEVGKDVPLTGQSPASSTRPMNLKFSE